MEIKREEVIKRVLENTGHADVKAYLNRDDPRHKEVVEEVTKAVERVFNEQPRPHLGLMESSERSIRQSLHDDPRSLDDQIKDIFSGNDEKWSKAYFDGGHPLHREAVSRVSILSDAKFDGQIHAPEIMPIVSRSATPNIRQADVIDSDFNSTTKED